MSSRFARRNLRSASLSEADRHLSASLARGPTLPDSARPEPRTSPTALVATRNCHPLRGNAPIRWTAISTANGAASLAGTRVVARVSRLTILPSQRANLPICARADPDPLRPPPDRGANSRLASRHSGSTITRVLHFPAGPGAPGPIFDGDEEPRGWVSRKLSSRRGSRVQARGMRRIVSLCG
jgi:hypothetical protein